MNFVNHYIFTPPVDLSVNTEIGAVAASINTPALLATKLAIDASRIANFSVVGSDIKCKITGSYVIPDAAFADNLDITYYQDKGDLVTALNTDCFIRTTKINSFEFKSAINIYGGAIARSNAKRIILNNATTIGINSFVINPIVDLIYIPRVTDLGGSALNNGCFNSSFIKYIYANPYLSTNNAGGEDGDIAAARANGSIIRFVINYTAPNPITNLSIGNVYSTAMQLNFTAPTGSTNTIEFYDCYANGVYKNTISGSGGFITGLSPNTSYTIEVKPVDIFYNKSTSNIPLVQLTGATYVIPSSNIVSYYKMENNVLDSVGVNNGTATGITYAAGLVGQNAIFNGTSSFVSIPDANNLSFTNGTNDLPFSISMIANFAATGDRWLINKRTATTGGDEYSLALYQNVLYLSLFNHNTSGNITKSCNFTPVLNQNYKLTVTYNGSGLHTGLSIYIDGASVGASSLSGVYERMNNGTSQVVIGRAAWASSFFFNGKIDEVSVFNTELNNGQTSEINAKLNSGQSLI